jgi:hypothetical protein
MVQPLAYMASTVVLETQKLAIFGGLTQDPSSGEFRVTNEVLFLDLQTARWQKSSKVFANSMEDVPAPRMGASTVAYGDKLWVYAGADPYGSGTVFSDFFSFSMTSGLWKLESSFSELKQADGTLLGQAIRMYNSDAVLFSGGCNTVTQSCSFGVTKSILFEQPQAHFTDGLVDMDEFSGRMGHSLVQLGDSVISFGGCSFGKVCTNELLIQKPRINAATSVYDCKNGGEIEQLSINHLVVSYCVCKDLPTGNGWNFFTGPQCQY